MKKVTSFQPFLRSDHDHAAAICTIDAGTAMSIQGHSQFRPAARQEQRK